MVSFLLWFTIIFWLRESDSFVLKYPNIHLRNDFLKKLTTWKSPSSICQYTEDIDSSVHLEDTSRLISDISTVSQLSEWFQLLESSDVGYEPVSVNAFGMDLVIWRDIDGKANVFEDLCPHRSAALSLGDVVVNPITLKFCLQCPYHGLQFDSEGICSLDPEDNKPKRFLKAKKLRSLEREGHIFVENLSNPNQKYFGSKNLEVEERMILPSGWWAIALTEEVTTEPIYLRRFGMNLTVFRNTEYEISVTANKCLPCPGSLSYSHIMCYENRGVIYILWGKTLFPYPNHFEDLKSHSSCVLQWESESNIGSNIEGQLDNTHVSFVHAKSFAPIAKSIMSREYLNINFSSNGVRWHYEDPEFYWDMKYPNILINPRNSEYSMTIIYAPIDKHKTNLYIRSHRTFLNDRFFPLWFKELVDKIYLALYLFITAEDQRIAVSQQRNILKYGIKYDKLYREDDKAILHYRDYASGSPKFDSPLSDEPFWEY